MSSPGLHWISTADPPRAFPDIELALAEPNGLLAAGGDLSVARLLYAYRHGIFPWFDEGQPILWWSPDPRCVIEPRSLHLSRRTRRALRSSGFTIEFNRRFEEIVAACAAPRRGQPGTWITATMRAAYVRLHELGWAHSVEVLRNEDVVGGLYGVAIGRLFFGESMFSAVTNGSKAAMLGLCRVLEREGFALMDCQIETPHLMSLGAVRMPRSAFRRVLEKAVDPLRRFDAWPDVPVDVLDVLETA